MKVGIIGLGQCGTSIVDEFSKKSEFAFASINTTANDSPKSQNNIAKYLIKDGKLGGMAKERENIKLALREDKEGFLAFLKNFIKSNEIEGLYLISSSGGGTGSGLISLICKNLETRISLRCILVTPNLKEGFSSHKNTLDVLTELQNYKTAIRVVSNNKYIHEETEAQKREVINRYICESEYVLLSAKDRKSLTDNIDEAEVDKLLFTKGFSSIYHNCIIDGKESTSDLIGKINTSFDLETATDKAIANSGLIFFGNTKTEQLISQEKIFDYIGIPEHKFTASFESTKEKAYLITSGCSAPDSITIYQDECKRLSESRKQFIPKNLQFDDADSTEDEIKILDVKIKAPKEKIKQDSLWMDELDLDLDM